MSGVARFSRIPQANALLLLSVLLVLLSHLPHLPPWLSVASIVVLGWRLLHDAGLVRLPGRFLRIMLVIGSILVLLLTYRTVVGREAGTSLLILMLTLKLFEMHSWRDVTVVIFLGFFVMVTAYLFSQSLWMGIYSLLVVVLFIASMVSFQHPAALITSRRLQRELRLALRLLGQAIPVALVLFVFFPRIPGPLWGLPADARSGYTGLSDQMEPGRISRLAESSEVAFRVRFDGAVPAPGRRYWRGPVMWRYDGRKWQAITDLTRPMHQLDLKPVGESVSYQVTLEPHNRKWLFGLDIPVMLPDNTQMGADYQFLARNRIDELYRYEMTSYTDYRLQARGLENRQRYLDVPADAAPRTRQLIQDLHAKNDSAQDMVNKVLDYFAEQPFYYTREPPLLFDDPVDEFVFETRRGFCEHYASTFTVMMRQAGIPARIVTGYYGGEMNPLADYMIVRQSSAHAWSEVWLDKQGWVRVDPTSVIPPSRVESAADLAQRQPEVRRELDAQKAWWQRSLQQAGFAWDALNNQWQQWVVGYNPSRQNALLRALGLENISGQMLGVLLIVALTGVLFIISVLLFVRRGPRVSREGRWYRRFLRKLERKGINRALSETPNQFSKRAARLQPAKADRIGQITRNYLLLRYANLDEQRQRELLKQFVRDVRRFSI